MKKGQKVRVLADGRVGVIADSHFVMWRGKKLFTCQVKFPDSKGEAPWFPIEQLTTELVERTTIQIKGEKGTLNLVFTNDHADGRSNLSVTSEPEDVLKHKGTHVLLMNAMLMGLSHVYGLNMIAETRISQL